MAGIDFYATRGIYNLLGVESKSFSFFYFFKNIIIINFWGEDGVFFRKMGKQLFSVNNWGAKLLKKNLSRCQSRKNKDNSPRCV